MVVYDWFQIVAFDGLQVKQDEAASNSSFVSYLTLRERGYDPKMTIYTLYNSNALTRIYSNCCNGLFVA